MFVILMLGFTLFIYFYLFMCLFMLYCKVALVVWKGMVK